MSGGCVETRKEHVLTGFPTSSSGGRTSDILLLVAPLSWIGIVYVGSLFALLIQSFYSLDDFSGRIVREFTLATYAQLLEEAKFKIILRTVTWRPW